MLNLLGILLESTIIVIALIFFVVAFPFLMLLDLYHAWRQSKRPSVAPEARPGRYMASTTQIHLSFDDDLETFKRDLRKHEKHIK